MNEINNQVLKILNELIEVSKGEKRINNFMDFHQCIESNLHKFEKLDKTIFKTYLEKILLGENNAGVINIMSHTGLLTVIIPEWQDTIKFDQKKKSHIFTVDMHTINAIGNAERDLIISLSLLLHDIGKPKCFTIDENGIGHFKDHNIVSAEMSKTILKRLGYSEDIINRVYNLIKLHLFYREQINKEYVQMMLDVLGPEDIYRFFKITEADKIAHKGPYDFLTIDRMKIYLYMITGEIK